MLNQSFTTKNLLRVFSYSDFGKYEIGRNKEELKECIEGVSKAILEDKCDFTSLREIQKDKFNKIYSVNDIVDEYALRKLNDNIRRLYKVKQANRFLIVNQIITLLNETVPVYVIKLDIEKFYESIDRKIILKKLIDDSLLSFHSKQILKKFFSTPQMIAHPNGLPRGINISATLSEIYMRDFDSRVSQIDGVYYYARYVDDVIIFAFSNPSDIIEKINFFLLKETTLSLNQNKTKELSKIICRCKVECSCPKHPCRCKDKCVCDKDYKRNSFDYLGYQFSFPDISGKRKNHFDLEVSLADKKCKKIKSRIVASFLDYLKNGNYFLLLNRIKFLTSNYKIKLNPHGKSIKAGIYYNYPHLNDKEKLKGLTLFLRKVINANKGSFGRKIRLSLTLPQRRELSKHCFLVGYENKLLRKFSSEDMRVIKKCWYNEV